MNHSDSEMQEISSSLVQKYEESNEIEIYNKFYHQTSVVMSNRL